jgi:sugar lactone lactonase YvrE
MQPNPKGSNLFSNAMAKLWSLAAVSLVLGGCIENDPKPVPHSLKGTVNGLNQSGLVVAQYAPAQRSGEVDTPDTPFSIAAGATTFTAPRQVFAGNSYALRVLVQPTGQQCSLANSTGIMPDVDVQNAVVTCASQLVDLNGNINGLTAAGLVLANGVDTVNVAAGANNFKLPAVAFGGSWNVTVKTQPAGQICTVANGLGQAGDSAKPGIVVSCALPSATTYAVGGTVAGLSGGNVELINGSDRVVVYSNGTSSIPFAFPVRVASGVTYNVAVRNSPPAKTCAVGNGSGTVASSDIASVSVICSSSAFALGGGITGLTSAGLVLANGIDTLNVAANATAFTMPQAVAQGTAFNLTVRTQPLGLVCTVANATGSMGSANIGNANVACVPATPQVTTLGGTGAAGYIDGSSSNSQFNRPAGLAVDAGGNVYVADETNNRIRKITPTGTVSTVAGDGTRGYADGPIVTARFNLPLGVAIDSAGNIIVADRVGNRIRKISPNGTASTLAGDGTAGYVDGAGISAQFHTPSSVALDSAGNIYVGDTDNQVIRKILPDGTVSTYAGSGVQGFADGSALTAQFNLPYGVAVDGGGNVYVADLINNRIRKISTNGTVSTVAGSAQGFADGSPSTAKFNQPYGVAVNSVGDLFVADFGNSRVRKISSSGTVSTYAGTGTSGYADGNATTAQFAAPLGIALDGSGNVFVGDIFGNRVRKIAPR